MREIVGNLFDPPTYLLTHTGNYLGAFPDAICITTNGFTKSNGDAVCGRGCAKEAVRRYPDFASRLGVLLRSEGNEVHIVLQGRPNVCSFPVKSRGETCAPDYSNVVRHMHAQFKVGEWVPGWACRARLEIISASAQQLVVLANEENWQTIVIPRPGCGAGELSWEQVKPVLSKILDDRFCSITTRNAY